MTIFSKFWYLNKQTNGSHVKKRDGGVRGFEKLWFFFLKDFKISKITKFSKFWYLHKQTNGSLEKKRDGGVRGFEILKHFELFWFFWFLIFFWIFQIFLARHMFQSAWNRKWGKLWGSSRRRRRSTLNILCVDVQ